MQRDRPVSQLSEVAAGELEVELALGRVDTVFDKYTHSAFRTDLVRFGAIKNPLFGP